MENAGNVLFDDRIPEWYVALGNNCQGPMTAAEVYRRVMQREISWAHFVWKKGQAGWQRVCDTPAFQPAVPHAPSPVLQQRISESSRDTVAKPAVRQAGPRSGARVPPPFLESPGLEDDPDVDAKIWFLFFNDTQFGPFSTSEIEGMIESGKIHSRVHVWQDGMAGWERLEKIARFQELLKQAPAFEPAPPAKKKKTEQREAPRRPLVAKILLSNDESVMVGVCRDISVGGMQVLTDRIPGEVGNKVKMNVSPPSGEQKTKFKPFVAEGRIVRVLEDGRGFSFRFERISDAAKRSIDAYIRSSE